MPMNKLGLPIIIGILLVLAGLGYVIFHGVSGQAGLGGPGCNSGNCTDYTAVNTSAGYYVADSQVVNSSGQWIGTILSSVSATLGFTTQGGGVTATTSNGAGTLTQANINVGSIEHTNTAATTITLPASTTITSLIPTAGQSFRLTYFNLGTGIDTIAGGSGTLLHVASSTVTTALKTVAPSGSAIFVFTRKSNTDIVVEMVPAQ